MTLCRSRLSDPRPLPHRHHSIVELNIPTGVPLVYELDDNLKPIPQKGAIAPLTGRYLGNQEEIRQRIEGVKNQTKKK